MFLRIPVKFFKRAIILSTLAILLITSVYGNYVYADKYAWNEGTFSGVWSHTVVSSDGDYVFGVLGNKVYFSINRGLNWTEGALFDYNDETISDIAINSDGSWVAVSTDNGGLYISRNYGDTFTSVGDIGTQGISTISMSGDGLVLFASILGTNIAYYSLDGGYNFTQINLPSLAVNKSTMSQNGQYIYLTDSNNCLNVSNNYGASFVQDCITASGIFNIYTNASGQYVLATPANGLGHLKLSDDYGVSFSDVGPNLQSHTWVAASISGDGSKMVGLASIDGGVYASNDFGITWALEPDMQSGQIWTDIAISQDGYLVSAVNSDSYTWFGEYDLLSPNITNITSTLANGTYTTGQIVPITVTFSEPIYSSDGTLTLTFETGATDRTCNVSIPNATATGTCSYTVQAGDSSSDLSVSAGSGNLSDENNTRTTGFTNLSTLASNKNIVIDAAAPSVSLTEPTIGTYASSSITISATSSDTDLVGVQFKYNNTNIGSEDISSPYTVSWDTTGVSDGSYTINAVARDTLGNTSTSSVSIVVNNVAPDAPTITSPVDGFSSEDLEYTIGGSCESGATVSISNNNLVTSPVTVACVSSLYTADIEFNSGTVGVETISVIQTDGGSRVSATTTSTVDIQEATVPSTPATSQSSAGNLTAKSSGPMQSPSLFQGGVPLNQITQFNSKNSTTSESQYAASKKLFDIRIPEGFRFTKNLGTGITNDDVKNLQKILNIAGFEVSSEGSGSVGNETSVFGEKTKTALQRFQKAFGIVPISGYFGYITRSILNDILDAIGY
jgi:hypothetical protein